MSKQRLVQRGNRGLIFLIAAFTLGAVITLAGFSLTSATPEGNVILTVNGAAVTQDAFYERLESEAGEHVLDLLISEILIEQAQDRKGINVTDEDVENELAQLKASYPNDEAFAEDLDRFGITPERLRHEFLLSLILRELRLEGIEITDDEIEQFFEENKEILGQPEEVLVAHILVETEKEADDVLKRLKDGADFAELAETVSVDSASAARGGQIGYITQNSPIAEPLKKAAFTLAKGETSKKPVQTEFGWHVLYVHDRTDAEEATLQSSAEHIRELLLQQKARTTDEVLHALREEAAIDVQWSRYEFLQTPR